MKGNADVDNFMSKLNIGAKSKDLEWEENGSVT